MGKKQSKKKRATRPVAKRAPRPASQRVSRKEPYSAARMGIIIEHVKEQTTRLVALAKNMDEATVDAVVIDGHAMLIRGLNQIDNFIDNASRAVREAKSAKLAM